MLKRIVDEHWFTPKAILGFWPANAVGDDIALYTGESRAEKLTTFTPCASSSRVTTASPISRWPISSRREAAARPIMSAPSSSPPGREEKRIAEKFAANNDDYDSILVKALADRVAEALAECLHARVRKRVLGLRAGRDRSALEELHQREVSRHPPGAGLSGPARPQREADDFRLARRRREASA